MQKMMFNDKYGLTEAVLNGTKKNTRRICKYDRPSDDWEISFPVFEANEYDDKGKCISPLNYAFGWINKNTGEEIKWNIPRYKVGEIVAIAQSYETICKIYNGAVCKGCPLLPNETPSDYGCNNSTGWNNKMFVKADLMPHQIQITNIRLERLQDISDEDCIAEGIMKGDFSNTWDKYYYNVIGDCICHKTFKTPKEAFASLIDRVSGKGTWESNPYVFVYEFKAIE